MPTQAHPGQAAFPASLVHATLGATGARRGGGMRVLGISGLQGSGKSSFAAQVVSAARGAGLSADGISLDDFYLTAAERRDLAMREHPLLATRGPPGTHDVPLALHTIDALREGGTPALPRFDKLGDERVPAAHWPVPSRPLDLLVLEGWCLAVPPQPEHALHEPVNALERDEDAGGRWRRFCNRALSGEYPSLWGRIDVLWVLQAPGFEVVPGWRLQQERALEAATPGRAGMDAARLARFVQHYERVSRHALQVLPLLADATVPLDAQRRPGGIARHRRG